MLIYHLLIYFIVFNFLKDILKINHLCKVNLYTYLYYYFHTCLLNKIDQNIVLNELRFIK